jgi:hypothetical protein
MAFTYEREVSHCQLSTYVKLYTIKEVIPAQNADTLDVIRFHENWYQAVVRGVISSWSICYVYSS